MSAVEKVMAATEERTVLLVARLLNEGLEALWAEREAAQRGEMAA